MGGEKVKTVSKLFNAVWQVETQGDSYRTMYSATMCFKDETTVCFSANEKIQERQEFKTQ